MENEKKYSQMPLPKHLHEYGYSQEDRISLPQVYQEAIAGNFRVVVPKDISLYEFADGVPVNTTPFVLMNDIYRIGYDYAPNYPANARALWNGHNKEMREKEDREGNVWIRTMM